MWCPDGIGRESWVRVVAPSQGESMTQLPRSGVVSARRKDRAVVSKRNVPTMRWLLLLLLLLNVIYSKQIIIDKDVDRVRLRLAYKKCSQNDFNFQKNQFGLRKTTNRQNPARCCRNSFPQK